MKRIVVTLMALLLALFATSAMACETCGCMDGGDAHEGHGKDMGEAGMAGHEHADGADLEHTLMHAEEHGLFMEVTEVEGFHVAHVSGTLADDIEALFGELMGAAFAQELMAEDTKVGSVTPNALTEPEMDKIQVWPCLTVDEGTEVEAPLSMATVAGGKYVMVSHIGSYDNLGDTWEAAITYCFEHGVDLKMAPCFEHYVSDPEVVPEEDLLTQIYLPLN